MRRRESVAQDPTNTGGTVCHRELGEKEGRMQDSCLPPRDLTRNTLAVLFVCALMFFTGWIVLPFLTASLWATTIVISTWPMLQGVQSKVGGRRGIATLVMTVVLLAVVIIPIGLATGAIIGSMDTIAARVNSLQTVQLPPPPDWVARIPIRGPKLAGEWQRLAAEGPGSVAAAIAPYSGV